jgi:hypothetical protein
VGKVTSGIGLNETVFLVGFLRAPDQEGTYTLKLFEVVGATIRSTQGGAAAIQVDPATAGTLSDLTIVVRVGGEVFRRGDADGSGDEDITDAIVLLDYMFIGGQEIKCLDAADADDNGAIEITDAIGILNYLFTGGETPPAPGPLTCGPDPTRDSLPPCTDSCR